jgi:hypothetical protein
MYVFIIIVCVCACHVFVIYDYNKFVYMFVFFKVWEEWEGGVGGSLFSLQKNIIEYSNFYPLPLFRYVYTKQFEFLMSDTRGQGTASLEDCMNIMIQRFGNRCFFFYVFSFFNYTWRTLYSTE